MDDTRDRPCSDDPHELLAEASAHLSSCENCHAEAASFSEAVLLLAHALPAPRPESGLRQQILDLALAPSIPIDVSAYEWQEPIPGVKLHVLRDEPERGMRACLAWGSPGARMETHRHLGDENILVLQGKLKDERGTYGPGDICRSRAGSVHTEEVLPGEDCVCYVVYYGPLEFLRG